VKNYWGLLTGDDGIGFREIMLLFLNHMVKYWNKYFLSFNQLTILITFPKTKSSSTNY